ncbi:MAG: hypothetical protein JST08_00880 [Actinobacteria bacterium]|nr:hypothetical protein [Actinomycetota bacterium]
MRDHLRLNLMRRPVYIATGDSAAFAVFHPASDPERAARPPVLICPPWGWADVASYRARRDWATRLAAAGFPTLRFDLPTTGNSGGEVTDAGVPGGWVAATLAAATWLADTEGTAGVAALGLGLGGLLAMAAIAAGAPILALALWGAPGRGKRFVRETQAFSRMQPWLGGQVAADGFDAGVPDGWLEAGGFALGPETLAELKGMAVTLPPQSSLSRVLLLDRDGIAPDPELAEAVEAAGVAVEPADGSGWGGFISHPELAVVPEATAAELEAWLSAQPVPVIGAATAPPAPDALDLEIGGEEVRETALVLGEPGRETIGLLAEPAAGTADDLCAVFLNAGAVRSAGPNRMWAETARRWASRGVPSLRIDLQGVGEADGEPAGGLQIGDFYAPRFGAQVGALLDELERREVGRRFILVGLCSGGYWAFRTAVADERVIAALLLNAGALRWVDDLPHQREAHRTSRALERRWWQKLLRREIEADRIVRLLRSVFLNALAGVRRSIARLAGRGESSLRKGMEDDLDLLRDRRTRVVLAFSEDEPLGEEVQRYRLQEQVARWPDAHFASLPGNDHTLRPLSAQRAASALLDEELALLLGAAASTSGRSASGRSTSGSG